MHTYAYLSVVDFEWDPAKAASNLRRHGVDFADGATVFHDELGISIPDDSSDEQRSVTIGSDALGRVLVVVYSWRQENIRIISARPANARERRQYEAKR